MSECFSVQSHVWKLKVLHCHKHYGCNWRCC